MKKNLSRRLDTTRLYKLLNILVVIITSISAFTAYWYGKSLGFFINGESIIANRWNAFCDGVTGDRTWCLAASMKDLNASNNMFLISAGIAILLPIIFYGGTALYKYLFPVENMD